MQPIRAIEDVPGIKIVHDITSAPGVLTVEGIFGPLLSAEKGACHFIDLQPGQFLAEHPHSTESLIYTIRGQWVLCSRGQRWHMRAGTLFWFGADVPTGWEVPFEESAFVLIFKTEPRDSDSAMIERLQQMARRLDDEHASGTPFFLRELTADHPARQYATALRGRDAFA